MRHKILPHEAPAAEADGAAAVEQTTARDGSGSQGPRGCLAVTRGELRLALWLSLVCAATAALVAVPASVAQFLAGDLSAAVGAGAVKKYALRDAERMLRREPFSVEFDWVTVTTRWPVVLANLWSQTCILTYAPVCYVAYLGASLKVCCAVLGSAVITHVAATAGFVISGMVQFVNYSPVLGLALLIVALKLVCARNSEIPKQATKQALVMLVGNVLVLNVIAEKTVRANSIARVRSYFQTL
jgi:hypothetical protein